MYELLRFLFKKFFYVIFRCKEKGVENIPLEGGVIIAANHLSLWDPPLAATYVPRHVHFMAKEELFKIPLFGILIKKLYAFPVRRGAADRSAIRTAIQLLKDGRCLGLFPEGTRNKNGTIGKPEPGVALIAVKAGVPIIPTAVIGTNKLLGPFEVRYGKAILFDSEQADKVQLQAFSEKIMQEIRTLYNEQDR